MKNIGALMKQAKEMQAKMETMQTEMEAAEIDGESGGGMVKVTVNGKGQMRALKVDPALVDPADVEVMEDLIIAAVNDAMGKSEAMKAEQMKDMTGGMPLPPGMKLPF